MEDFDYGEDDDIAPPGESLMAVPIELPAPAPPPPPPTAPTDSTAPVGAQPAAAPVVDLNMLLKMKQIFGHLLPSKVVPTDWN